MPYTIEIDDEDIPDFIETLLLKLKSIQEQKQKLDLKEKSINDTLNRLRASHPVNSGASYSIASANNIPPSPLPILPEGYSVNMTWIDKVIFFIKQANRGLTTTEIIDEVMKVEPKYREDRRTAMRSISATVSAKSREGGRLKKVMNDSKEFVYSINENHNMLYQGNSIFGNVTEIEQEA